MKRSTAFLLLLLPCSGALHAQKDRTLSIDSLSTVWKDASQSDTTRFKAMQEVLIQRRYSAPPDSLLALARQLVAFTHDRGLQMQEATAWNLTGNFHNNMSQWDSAEVAYHSSLHIWETLGERGRMAGCYNNLGNVAGYKGDQGLAIEYLTNSLRIGEELGDSSVIARALGNIGVCHFDQKEYDVALDYFHRRIAVADAIGDKQCSLEAYICIGMLHDERHEPALARKGYINCLRLAREIDDVTSICVTLNALGTGDVAQGNYQRGLAYLDSSLAMATEHGDPAYESSALAEIAHAHHLQGMDSKALPIAQRAMAKAREAGTPEGLRDAAEVNYGVLKALGNQREALEMHELYIAMRDSVTNDENKRAVMSKRFQYAYEKKEALLQAEQAKRQAVDAEALRRKNVQRNAFIGGFGLMVLLAGSLFLFYRNSRRNGRLLAEKNSMILHAQIQLVESERAREASEVRTRIARDVHDQLGSDLTKLVMLSTEAKEVAKADTTDLHGIANDIERIAGEANRSLGDIVWAIDPHHDSLAGLTERVRAHCERMLKWSKLEHTVDCVHDGPDRTLDPATKRDIYLIVREALNNAIKYAKARHISVRFHSSPVELQFEVKDDGVGMSMVSGSGHGLENMKHRAERVGGILDIQSGPDMGTRVAFRTALAAD